MPEPASSRAPERSPSVLRALELRKRARTQQRVADEQRRLIRRARRGPAPTGAAAGAMSELGEFGGHASWPGSAPGAAMRVRGPGIPSSGGSRHSLLDLDSELGRHLTPARYAAARADILAQVHWRPTGPWPVKVMPTPVSFHLGVLVLEGVIASDVALEDVVGTELLGAGDLLWPWQVDDPERMVGDEGVWMVLAPCRMVVLDQCCAVALGRYRRAYERAGCRPA